MEEDKKEMAVVEFVDAGGKLVWTVFLIIITIIGGLAFMASVVASVAPHG